MIVVRGRRVRFLLPSPVTQNPKGELLEGGLEAQRGVRVSNKKGCNTERGRGAPRVENTSFEKGALWEGGGGKGV